MTKKTMKIITIMIFLIALSVAPSTSRAQTVSPTERYCLLVASGAGRWECSYRSLEECKQVYSQGATGRAQGNSCMLNPALGKSPTNKK
jgi:hypothetical protein